MTAIKHPVLLWELPVAALIIIFWLSLFCYSAIPVSGADATPRPAAWTHANATRSAGAKPSFATKPGRRSDRRKPGARGARCCKP
ncbi:iron(III) dicitrate transport system, permease protein [Escherichia coli]|uniref:Iron(III) dicitrate transport system, permease protein n=1 Tax=Escherichia coli TaxID=562 RepID=A0A2X3M745_ECOLX|nr:iron(III) dicitrate transport system, permease protein [Escherichia coli]